MPNPENSASGPKWPADRVERWPIERLIPDARNARTHSAEQVAQIAGSMRTYRDHHRNLGEPQLTRRQYPPMPRDYRPSLVDQNRIGPAPFPLIAAEMTGRRGFAIDIDPLYVDVAVQRWHRFAGKIATLDGDGRAFAEVSAERRTAQPPPPATAPEPAPRRRERKRA
jgi:hypothetical protein